MAARNPKGRRPQARGEARREAILDAAVRLFARRGFRGTGVLGLANEVGITHSGVLHHFGSKERLLLAVVDRRDREQSELIEHLRRLRGLEALRAIELIAEDTVADPLHARLFTVLIAENLHPDDPLNGYFRNRYALLRAFVAHAVRSGQEDGELGAGADPEAVAVQVMAFVVGMQVQWLLHPEAIDLEAAYRDYLGELIAKLSSESG
jgi:AcrR family transcriptional regulator